MLDFDVPLNQPKKIAEAVEVAPRVVETVRVIPHQSAGHLTRSVSEWNWSDLRDYIIEQVEQRHGPQVRDPKKEAGICKAFISRWGIEKAAAIARAAFDVHDGMWRNAPITILRFTKGNDPYFSEVINKNLV